MTARWALRWWPDVRAAVDDLVSLAGVNRGTDFTKVACAEGACAPAYWQLARDSRFVAALNAGDESPGEVDYTSLYSRADEIAFPQVPESVSDIEGAVNVPLDALCPGRFPGHVQAHFDAVAYAATIDALTHDGPFDPTRFDPAACTATFLPGVREPEAAGRIYTIYEKGAALTLAHPKVDAEPPLRCYTREQGCGTG